ncbi:PQQ-dependent sugar dehydrogenase [Corallincola spongiicola]|nr:PQQ-dependent sugar dehydrogenase [Corallincola spongiicola]
MVKVSMQAIMLVFKSLRCGCVSAKMVTTLIASRLYVAKFIAALTIAMGAPAIVQSEILSSSEASMQKPFRQIPSLVLSPVFPDLALNKPLFLTHAGDGSDRIFLVEQGGAIKVVANGSDGSDAKLFFDIQSATKNRFTVSNEEGLLGLAFDPNYRTNGYFYVYYSAVLPRRSVISRFRVSPDDPNRFEEASEHILLTVEQDYRNHNGGMLVFGPDDYLYVGLGDGGSAGDPHHRAQDLSQLLGKILRLDVLGRAAPDNPFAAVEGARDEIWAYGLRNPWRFSFDRKTGDLWAADVGQNSREEVNKIVRGGNYGWRWFEGNHSYQLDEDSYKHKVIMPVVDYSHQLGQSVTGGYVYRGARFPQLNGWYLFGDYVSGRLWALDTALEKPSMIAVGQVGHPSSFGEDEAGELYMVSYVGQIYLLMPE